MATGCWDYNKLVKQQIMSDLDCYGSVEEGILREKHLGDQYSEHDDEAVGNHGQDSKVLIPFVQ